jgi:hypothetical protein
MVTLYCEETPNLKLGPGVKAGDPDIIEFRNGYAEVDPSDPLFRAKMAWLVAPGTPFIRVLDSDEAKSAEEAVVKCPECERDGVVKAFASDRALNGHLIQHRKKG